MSFSILGKYISILYRQERKLLNYIMREYDLGYSSYNFILYISSHPGSSQKEVCHNMVIDEALATRSMKKLERQGYLTRRREALDGRTYSLFLTPQGQELVPVIRRALEQWWEQLTAQADLSQEELEIILPLLRKMSDSSSLTLMKIINTNH